MKKFKFRINATDGLARCGEITTAHGKIHTPVFMPVGTRATVKTLSPREIKESKAQIILGNTYHLYLKPGDKLIKKMGGLHQFMQWDGPILTDSGGFQVFSLGLGARNKKPLVKLFDDKVEFSSHIDGSKHIFNPKKVLDIQDNLGVDIAMVLDECSPGKASKEYAKKAMERTHTWAKEAIEYDKQQKFSMAVFGIVQGGVYPELRKESAKYINSLDFQGNAIGGLAVGESKKDMYKSLEATIPFLSADKPRYFMGLGSPEDIIESVGRGVDMFDSVMPTRIARNGTVLTFDGKLNLNNSKFTFDKNPIEKDCDCYTCINFSRSYIRHLITVGEVLGIRLTTIHNVRFMMRLMEQIRESIRNGEFEKYKKKFLKNYL